MMYEKQPDNFNQKLEVAGCFLENIDGKFLVLLRNDNKPQGNTWGVPSGKVDNGETVGDCILRELFEETGNIFEKENLNYFKKFYVRYDEYDFIYHIFHIKLDKEISVVLEEGGHKDFKYVTPEESLKLNYIQDFDECVKLFYGIK